MLLAPIIPALPAGFRGLAPRRAWPAALRHEPIRMLLRLSLEGTVVRRH
jgi:hypothetical protein